MKKILTGGGKKIHIKKENSANQDLHYLKF